MPPEIPAIKSHRRKRPVQLAVQRESGAASVSVPKLPHEHDESPEAAARPDPAVLQAHADVSRGLVDTDARETAGRSFDAVQSKRRPR